MGTSDLLPVAQSTGVIWTWGWRLKWGWSRGAEPVGSDADSMWTGSDWCGSLVWQTSSWCRRLPLKHRG